VRSLRDSAAPPGSVAVNQDYGARFAARRMLAHPQLTPSVSIASGPIQCPKI